GGGGGYEPAFKPLQALGRPMVTRQGLEPDPGNLAVRDSRGASANVRQGETVNPFRNRKSGNGNPSPTARRGRFLSRPSSTVTLRHPDASWGAVHLINSGCRCGLPGAALARPVLLRYLTRLPRHVDLRRTHAPQQAVRTEGDRVPLTSSRAFSRTPLSTRQLPCSISGSDHCRVFIMRRAAGRRRCRTSRP